MTAPSWGSHSDTFPCCGWTGQGGGAGVKGCREIAHLIREVAPGASRIVLPVGTGTTLAGIVSGLAPTAEVVGISALKGALDLDQRGFDW